MCEKKNKPSGAIRRGKTSDSSKSMPKGRGIDTFEKRNGIGENPPPTSMKPGLPGSRE